MGAVPKQACYFPSYIVSLSISVMCTHPAQDYPTSQDCQNSLVLLSGIIPASSDEWSEEGEDEI